MRVCGTQSVWTVDLAYLLNKYSVEFTFHTINDGVRPEYGDEARGPATPPPHTRTPCALRVPRAMLSHPAALTRVDGLVATRGGRRGRRSTRPTWMKT